MGARKFWRENLTRLKYYNPAVPMFVNRHDEPEGSAILSIYIRDDGTTHRTLKLPPAPQLPQLTASSDTSAEGAAAGEGEGGVDAEGKSAAKATEGEDEEGDGEGTAAADAASAKQPSKKAPKAGGDPWAQHTSNSHGNAKALPPARGERVVTINMKLEEPLQIWTKVLEATGAKEQVPSAEDHAEIERISRLREQASKDRAFQKAVRDEIKAEKQMLERARKEADALKAD